jgi:hypothetical protein
MLAIHTPLPIGRTPAPPEVGEAVAAVGAVAPVRRVTAEGSPARRGHERAPALLPQPPAVDHTAEAKASPVGEAAPLLPRPRTEEDVAVVAEERAAPRVPDVPPQERVADVWRASARVVESALGRPDDAPGGVSGEDAGGRRHPGGVVLSYDASGLGTTAGPPPGALLNERI